MYKFDDGQISIHEFGQLIGMKLRSSTLEKLTDYRNRVEYLNAVGEISFF